MGDIWRGVPTWILDLDLGANITVSVRANEPTNEALMQVQHMCLVRSLLIPEPVDVGSHVNVGACSVPTLVLSLRKSQVPLRSHVLTVAEAVAST